MVYLRTDLGSRSKEPGSEIGKEKSKCGATIVAVSHRCLALLWNLSEVYRRLLSTSYLKDERLEHLGMDCHFLLAQSVSPSVP